MSNADFDDDADKDYTICRAKAGLESLQMGVAREGVRYSSYGCYPRSLLVDMQPICLFEALTELVAAVHTYTREENAYRYISIRSVEAIADAEVEASPAVQQ